MKRTRLIPVVLLLSFLFISPAQAKEKSTKNNMDLILKLESDKEIYTVGDKIKFSYTFFNNGSDSVYVYPWGGGLYDTDCIAAYDHEGNRLLDLFFSLDTPSDTPLREYYVSIEPKESYSLTFEGELKEAEFSKFMSDDYKKYKGIFIDFGNAGCAIFLDKPGEFTIKAFYNGMDLWKEQAKKFYNLDNVLGECSLESNEIKIVVKEK